MIATDSVNKKVFVLTSQLSYCQRFTDNNFANKLVLSLNSLGFISYDYQKDYFSITKGNKKKDGLVIFDYMTTGKFSLSLRLSQQKVGLIDYKGKNFDEVAKSINEIYDIEFETESKDDSTPSKEDVEKQIRALRYLAEAGDDEAQKQINALKYLLN
jgi:hypothetical protein